MSGRAANTAPSVVPTAASSTTAADTAMFAVGPYVAVS